MAITSKNRGSYASKVCSTIATKNRNSSYSEKGVCVPTVPARFVYGIGIWGRGAWGLGTGDIHFNWGHRIYGLQTYGIGLAEPDIVETTVCFTTIVSKNRRAPITQENCIDWTTVNDGSFSVRNLDDCDYSTKTCTAFVADEDCEAYATSGDGDYVEDNEQC